MNQLLYSLVLAFATLAHASNHWNISAPFPKYDFLDMKLSPSGLVIALSGEGIVRSMDGGLTWKDWERPAGPNFVDLAFASDSIVFGVGLDSDLGTNARSADSGKTWSAVVYDSPISRFEKVAFMDKDTGVAVGQNSMIRTMDGGKSWKNMYPYPPGFFRDIAFSKTGNGVAVTRYYDVPARLWYTKDAGRSWSQSDTIKTDAWNWHLAFAGDNVAVAAGDYGDMFRTIDGGATWQALPKITARNLTAISFDSKGMGLTVSEGGEIFRTLDQGEHWVQAVHAFGPVELVSVALREDGIALASGKNNTLLRSADGGATWVRISVGFSVFINGIASYGAKNLIAATKSRSIFRSDDSGKTWNNAGELSDTMRAITVTDNGVAVAVGHHGRIFRSVDGGSAWTEIASPLPPDSSDILISVAFSGNGKGVAVGTRGIILSTRDAGLSWSRVNQGLTANTLLSVSMAQDGKGVSVGENLTFLRTEDGGQNWVQSDNGVHHEAGNSGTVRQVVLHNSGWGIAVGRRVWVTTNGGKIWLESVGPSSNYASVAISPNGTAILVETPGSTVFGESMMFGSTDYSNWDPIHSTRAFMLLFTSGSTVIAAGGGFIERNLDFDARPSRPVITSAGSSKLYWIRALWAHTYEMEFAKDSAFSEIEMRLSRISRDPYSFNLENMSPDILVTGQLIPGTHFWRIRGMNSEFTGEWSQWAKFDSQVPVELASNAAKDRRLGAPSLSGGMLRYQLSESSPVLILLYDAAGHTRPLFKGYQEPGRHGLELPAGFNRTPGILDVRYQKGRFLLKHFP